MPTFADVFPSPVSPDKKETYGDVFPRANSNSLLSKIKELGRKAIEPIPVLEKIREKAFEGMRAEETPLTSALRNAGQVLLEKKFPIASKFLPPISEIPLNPQEMAIQLATSQIPINNLGVALTALSAVPFAKAAGGNIVRKIPPAIPKALPEPAIILSDTIKAAGGNIVRKIPPAIPKALPEPAIILPDLTKELPTRLSKLEIESLLKTGKMPPTYGKEEFRFSIPLKETIAKEIPPGPKADLSIIESLLRTGKIPPVYGKEEFGFSIPLKETIAKEIPPGPNIKAKPAKFPAIPKFRSEITVQPSLFPTEQKMFIADVGGLIDSDIVKLSKTQAFEEPSAASITFTDPARLGLEMDKTGTFNRKQLDPWFRAENRANEYSAATFRNFMTKFPEAKEGDALSAAIQRIGEERALPTDSKFNTPRTREIIGELRKSYDDMLDLLNQARATAKQDPIPRRKDFFTHFNDISLLSELFNIVETPAKDLSIANIGSPKSPFFRSALRRLGGEFTDDAIGGYKKYIEGASRVIHLTEPGLAIKSNLKFLPPNAQVAFREMVDYGFGKQPQTSLDRFFLRSPQGRALNNAASRAVANVVGGNWGVALAQSGSMPIIVERAGPINTIRALADIYGPDAAAKRAFARKVSIGVRSHLNESEFTNNLKNGYKRIVNLPVSMMDEEMSQLAFFAGLRKARSLKMGMKQAISYADNQIVNPANVIYNKSNTPAFLRTATTRNLLPLQRFSTNLTNYVIKDLPKSENMVKSAAALTGSTIAMTAMSKAISDILGITSMRDPIEADDVPFVRLIKYGINPPLLRAAYLGGVGTVQMARGKTKEGGKNILKAGLLTALPIGGKQIINLIEGRPLGGKKPKNK